MTNDMFKSKSEQLLDWCRSRGIFGTSDANQFGYTIYLNDASRYVRLWVKKKVMRKLTKYEMTQKGITSKQAYYEVNA